MFGVNLAKIRLMVWSLDLPKSSKMLFVKFPKSVLFVNVTFFTKNRFVNRIVIDLKAVSHTFDQNRLSSFFMYKLIFMKFLGQSTSNI